MTKNELIAHLVTYMGGRAAEEIVFDSVTTGASNDIEQATKMARAMVTQYGMSEKFGLMGLVTVENQYLDGRASLNCGEETAAQIDQEVMKILKESYDEAKRLLTENRDILDEVSDYLYQHETITGKEFMQIFRRMKGIPEPEEKTEAEKAAEQFQAEEKQAEEKQAEQKQTEKKPEENKEEVSVEKEESAKPEEKPEEKPEVVEVAEPEEKTETTEEKPEKQQVEAKTEEKPVQTVEKQPEQKAAFVSPKPKEDEDYLDKLLKGMK